MTKFKDLIIHLE